MKIAVVILNWNTKEYLERFLPGVISSCEEVKEDRAEVIVADNHSTDGSLETMAEKFPAVRVIRMDQNYGFTGGYNKALGALKEEDWDVYVLLNTDVQVSNDWILPLADWMKSHPECGACAPKLHSWYEKDQFEYAGAAGGFLDSYGFPFCRGRVMEQVEMDKGQYDEVKDVFWATGACLMVRSDLYWQLGGLDDRFFAHMEEIDLCWRMQLEGYHITVIPQSVVWHLGGGTLPQTSPWKLKLNYRNNLLMLENNLAKTYSLEMPAEKAWKRARRKIFQRMLIDGLSGLAYLCLFRWSFFKAVLEAHKEYRQKRRRCTLLEIEQYRQTHDPGNVHVQGIYPKWIIPRALLRGKKIFNLVHQLQEDRKQT